VARRVGSTDPHHHPRINHGHRRRPGHLSDRQDILGLGSAPSLESTAPLTSIFQNRSGRPTRKLLRDSRIKHGATL
jgi:hypothetical protein